MLDWKNSLTKPENLFEFSTFVTQKITYKLMDFLNFIQVNSATIPFLMVQWFLLWHKCIEIFYLFIPSKKNQKLFKLFLKNTPFQLCCFLIFRFPCSAFAMSKIFFLFTISKGKQFTIFWLNLQCKTFYWSTTGYFVLTPHKSGSLKKATFQNGAMQRI